jgi:hypothetical protein
VNEDLWTVSVTSTFKNDKWEFKLGQGITKNSGKENERKFREFLQKHVKTTVKNAFFRNFLKFSLIFPEFLVI